MARTFQVVRLFKDFTVRENVEVATIAATGAANGRPETWPMGRSTVSASPTLPTSSRAYCRRVRSGGSRSRGRWPPILDFCCSTNLARAERRRDRNLLPTLQRIRDETGCGMLIVDHDMRLIMNLCDRLHVLNYGRTIAEGLPGEVRRIQTSSRPTLGSEVEP